MVICAYEPGMDSRVGYRMASFDLRELVPTTLVKLSSTRTVEADITVNGFDADARFPIAQHPPYDLLGLAHEAGGSFGIQILHLQLDSCHLPVPQGQHPPASQARREKDGKFRLRHKDTNPKPCFH